jgi:hypothetical protein
MLNKQQRLAKTRVDAGQVYYPAAYSHMVEQHWDFLHSPRSEDSENEPMGKYASAAAARLRFSLDMLVSEEAPDKLQESAYAGAMSRRCPVQDAQDYWGTLEEQAQEEQETLSKGFRADRSSPGTDGSASSPDGSIVGTGLGAGTGSMDTCAFRQSPSYTGDAFSLDG